MTGASSAEESTDIVQACMIVQNIHDSADIHRNNTEGMKYNTNLRKKQK